MPQDRSIVLNWVQIIVLDQQLICHADNKESALTCYKAGGSLYFRSSDDMANTFVEEVSRSLGMNSAARYRNENDGGFGGEIETFCLGLTLQIALFLNLTMEPPELCTKTELR